MTASSGNQYFVGARKGHAFALTTAGLPAAGASVAVYEGQELKSIKGFDVATPDARRISHTGNDRVAAVDFLPSLEAVTGEIRVAPSLQTLNSSLTNVNTFALGDILAMPWQTEDQGTEADVSLLIFQQSLDVATKLRAYRGLIIPRARAIPVLAGMNDNAGEVRYQIVASPSTKHIWGTALSVLIEGATEAAAIETMTALRPKVVAWLAEIATVDFLFPIDKPCADLTGVSVWKNGVLVDPADYTVISTKITFDVAPTVSYIVAFYEY